MLRGTFVLETHCTGCRPELRQSSRRVFDGGKKKSFYFHVVIFLWLFLCVFFVSTVKTLQGTFLYARRSGAHDFLTNFGGRFSVRTLSELDRFKKLLRILQRSEVVLCIGRWVILRGNNRVCRRK